MEIKTATVGQVLDVNEQAGTVTFLASVTGVLDEVGDVIEPGAFAESLRQRHPEFLLGHVQGRRVGDVLDVTELMPGDPRLPATLADGTPWPAEAGALLVTARYDRSTVDGKDARDQAQFYGSRTAYSIGYVPHRPQRKSWRGSLSRLISRLDLHEVSQVLHGANRHAVALAVKAAVPAGLEFKSMPTSTTSVLLSAAEVAEARQLVADAVTSGDLVTISVDEFKAARRLADPDGDGRLGDPYDLDEDALPPGTVGSRGLDLERFYDQALVDEVEHVLVGTELVRAVCEKCGRPAGRAAGGQRWDDSFRCRDHAGAGWST